MPTSSQSKILSAVDYQLLQQQHQQSSSGQDTTAKDFSINSVNAAPVIESKRRLSKDDRRSSIGRKDDDDNMLLTPLNRSARRRSSEKIGDGIGISRLSQLNDARHMPTVSLNQRVHYESTNCMEPSKLRRTSLDDNNNADIERKLKQLKNHLTSPDFDDENNSSSDAENTNNEDNKLIHDESSSVLNEYARRLLILGTIRPSKTFYKDLPEADVEHLMEYFRRMRKTNRIMTSEEINQELQSQFIEYKPKVFFDSSNVTKKQVVNIEKLIEQYADKIRANQAELAKLENPIRFVIKQLDNDIPLTTIPREYNDCMLTLITRSDPLHKSHLVTELVQNKLVEDVKANSLDISYFPGGVNYDVPHDDIDENGQMKIETYQKLKKRLNNRKIWYFSEAPEKKPNALLAIVPLDPSISMNHQRLFDCLGNQLKSVSTNEDFAVEERIISIEFMALSCILNSYDISNQFIIDCDSTETKKKLLEKPLKFASSKQTFIIELHSYDEYMHKEYQKSIKAEKYRELVKNHDEAIKRTSSTK